MEMQSSAPIRPYVRLVSAALSKRGCARLWVWLSWLLALGNGVAPVLAQEPAQPTAATPEPPPPAAENTVTQQTLSDQVAKLEAELAAQRVEIEQLKAAGSQDTGAELVAIISQSEQGGSSETIEEPLLRAYGFADVGLQRMWADPEIA